MAEADVVIVGSGATGSLLAARLGAAGHEVVVLEGGPPRRLDRMYSSTIWSRNLKWAGPPARIAGENPVTFPFEAGWGRGGSALHHYACWFRLHEEDFRIATLHGTGFDWPIEYRDLQPYYDALQKEVGLSGDKDQEIWRPPGEPYPMPPQPTFRQAQLLADGFAKQGLKTAPLPMAINSVTYNGRPACLQDGWCDAGCPTGALANPIVIFGEAMKKAGVETRYNAFVSRLLTKPSGRRVQSVEYFEDNGTKKTIDAKIVVLAAFAVQTPRILLNSANDRHPNGLANSSGRVGRYFTPHAAVNLYGMFSEETENHMGRTGGQLMCQDDYSPDPARGLAGGYTWRIGAALKLADLGGLANARLDLFGERLKTFMDKASKHLATMSALIANQPSFENCVTLTGEKDKNGIPLARLTNTLGRDAKNAAQGAIKQGLEIFKAAGAHEAWAAPLRTEHMMGGMMMGEDPAQSVTDGHGRTHDVENLFISGPGLMPTVGAVNPTFTASALAARTADYIIENWAGFGAS